MEKMVYINFLIRVPIRRSGSISDTKTETDRRRL